MIKGTPSQEFIPIKEIRDGVVVLNDNSLRMVVTASSLNLALKSQEEQEATLSQFQNFLNSLEFSLQIVVQSRRLDIRPYLEVLEQRLAVQTEDLLRTQTAEYIGFIKWFTESTNIMSKDFFIVIPYQHSSLGEANTQKALSGLFSFGKKEDKKPLDESALFEEKRNQLEQRVGIVQSGLSSIGIRTIPLGTQEAIEMYYKMFNPGEEQRSVPDTTH